jgi:formamidopyrimidine-DNA glycosylase
MPELPETETIARDLHSALQGAVISDVEVHHADVLRVVTPREIAVRVRDAAIHRSWRRAKLVVLDLSTGDHLVVQPRFTGALLVDDGSLDAGARQYTAIAFRLADGRVLRYRDVRRLGTVSLMDARQFGDYTGALGIEPLDPAFSAPHLSVLLRGSRQAIKKVLMDQHRIAGIGNIYANEALWRARLDPSRMSSGLSMDEVDALREAIVGVLTEAIAARGTTFRDFRDSRGEPGGFASSLTVYGRAGHPCPRCSARLVGTHAIDGRATVLCARCQC